MARVTGFDNFGLFGWQKLSPLRGLGGRKEYAMRIDTAEVVVAIAFRFVYNLRPSVGMASAIKESELATRNNLNFNSEEIYA